MPRASAADAAVWAESAALQQQAGGRVPFDVAGLPARAARRGARVRRGAGRARVVAARRARARGVRPGRRAWSSRERERPRISDDPGERERAPARIHPGPCAEQAVASSDDAGIAIAATKPERELDQVAGSRALVARAAEPLHLEQRGEQAADGDERAERRPRARHDDALQRGSHEAAHVRPSRCLESGRYAVAASIAARHGSDPDRDCVHCGFCLPSCPTYVVFNEEMDSPRGRICLMQAALDGTVELNRTVAEHFDRCLGCMACLTSCPSGVKYDKLIELAREQVEEQVPRPLSRAADAAGRCSPCSRIRRGCARLLPFSRLPAPGPFKPLRELAPTWREPVSPPVETPARGEKLARVGLLTGCVQSVLFGEVNRASARVLSAYGYEVTAPYGECCGALALHAGKREEGLAQARRDGGRRSGPRARRRSSRTRPAAARTSRRRSLDLPVADISELVAAGRAPERAPAAAARRLPGGVPPRPRAARALGAAGDAALDPGARARRAGRAGDVLRQRRDLQPRPAGGGAHARRPQGRRTCSRSSRTSTRARTPAACSR